MTITRCLNPSKSHFVIAKDGKSIRFEPCQVESHNANDVEQHYCALCKEIISPKLEWFTEKMPGDVATFIKDAENKIVGSIIAHQGNYEVEILWSGASGDIKGRFADYAQALCFVEGVNKSMIAMRDIRG
jgi:hypothetical protein